MPDPLRAPARRTVEEHQADVAALLSAFTGPRPSEQAALADCLGRVLADDVRAPVDLPLFRNSQMDGFAVRAADVVGASPEDPRRLPVLGEVPAGPGRPAPLAPGSAARIMTGAPVPEGADAIVPVEDTDAGAFGGPPSSDAADAQAASASVGILVPRAVGDFVREAGSDVRAGDVLLTAGVVLGTSQLAAAAACGLAALPVVVRPRVSVVSTGSELLEPGDAPGPGQIYDANLLALSVAVREAGGVVAFTARTSDDADELARALREAAAASDLVITSGGVSQGAYEVVKDVLRDAGGVDFRPVAMQPGGPQGLGRIHGTPILTFPGNPVSSQVSFVVFARELLARGAGRPAAGPRERRTLDDAVTSPAGRRQLLRGLRGQGGQRGTVSVVGGPGSHLVASMARADVLIDVPADVTALAAGDEVEVWEL